MRPLAFLTTAGLGLALLTGVQGNELEGKDPRTGKAPAPAAAKKAAAPKAETGGCGNHGTSVQCFDTPSEAAKRAKKEQKLRLVPHVAGHLQHPEPT